MKFCTPLSSGFQITVSIISWQARSRQRVRWHLLLGSVVRHDGLHLLQGEHHGLLVGGVHGLVDGHGGARRPLVLEVELEVGHEGVGEEGEVEGRR